jgi:hypothetical protein
VAQTSVPVIDPSLSWMSAPAGGTDVSPCHRPVSVLDVRARRWHRLQSVSWISAPRAAHALLRAVSTLMSTAFDDAGSRVVRDLTSDPRTHQVPEPASQPKPIGAIREITRIQLSRRQIIEMTKAHPAKLRGEFFRFEK